MRLLLPFLVLLLAAGCAAKSEKLPPATGGLAEGDAARLSLLMSVIREQHSELNAPALKQGSQQTPDADAAELVLRGEGAGLRPGIQVGQPETAAITLFLDKRRYDSGRIELAVGGRPPETWRVVARELRGDVTGNFELLLALADGESRVRYLALAGGPYDDQAGGRLAYVGTLIVPGPGVNIEKWQRLYWFNFGDTYPLQPEFWSEVDRSNDALSSLTRQVSTLEGLRDRTARLQQDRDATAAQTAAAQTAGAQTAAQPAPPERADAQAQADARAKDLARRDQQIAGLRADLQRQIAATHDAMIRYWAQRAEIDRHYAVFSQSNAYTWRDKAQQQAWFDHWKQVEFHHPRIDELQKRLGTFVADPKPLEDARKRALDQINESNNWARNPAKPEPRPR